MAAGSHQGWFGVPPEKRFCVYCGERVRQKDSLFISGMFQVVWHACCRKPWANEGRRVS